MSDSDEDSSVASSSSSDNHDDKASGEPSPKKQKTSLSVPSAGPLQLAPSSNKNKKNKPTPQIIVLLDQATIETIKNKKNVYELLNCDDHRDLCRKKLKKDPNDYRPDILHQELLALLDSPLNKAGLLQVYVHTSKHVLIEINPATRIPRTYKRFAGLMVQLLHKMKIKAAGESKTLLKVIKNPFSQHLPPGTRCYGFSCQGELYSPINLAKELVPSNYDDSKTPPTCFVLGAMASGHITVNDHPYIEKMLSISEYPLSGASALSRIMGGIEHHWGIV